MHYFFVFGWYSWHLAPPTQKNARQSQEILMLEPLRGRHKSDNCFPLSFCLSFVSLDPLRKNTSTMNFMTFLSVEKNYDMLCDLHVKSFTIQNNNNKVKIRVFSSVFSSFSFLFFGRRRRFASIRLLNS